MLRGKIYSCTDKKTYSVSFIDYRNKKMIAISNGQKKEFDFKEVEWLEATGYTAGTSMIYRQDFILATKDNEVLSGIVIKKFGAWHLCNKKRGLSKSLRTLKESGYIFVNLKNSKTYFKNKLEKK
ncbi:hypothetical protein [Fusobacterium polymorphum]|uniref:hypothetical protein n=1 Tax=Fusobacterium nucleatum subsp. polymorphum TaxID=76857 RepID=UPI0030090361